MRDLASVERLTAQFCKLPGIGAKTARRLAYFVVDLDKSEVEEFAKALIDAKQNTVFCKICGNLSESDICSVCADPKRDEKTICVVRDIKDVQAIENTNEYRGLYHVLGGTISPLEGIGPDDISIAPLIKRASHANEVIIATNPDVSGEATAAYIAQLLSNFNVRVTRIAYGIPMGAELEYADKVTLARALEGRTEI